MNGYKKSFEQNPPGFIEYRIVLSNNEEKWVRAIAEAILDDTGNLSQMFGTVQDITERKQAEEEINQSKILLESSIESPKDMIILSLDREYRYLYFNKTHEETMGNVYGTRPRIGDCIFDHMTVKDDVERVKVHYDRALAGDGHVDIEEYCEDQLRYYYEVRYNPIFNKKME